MDPGETMPGHLIFLTLSRVVLSFVCHENCAVLLINFSCDREIKYACSLLYLAHLFILLLFIHTAYCDSQKLNRKVDQVRMPAHLSVKKQCRQTLVQKNPTLICHPVFLEEIKYPLLIAIATIRYNFIKLYVAFKF